jgi:hypothetical protein
MALHLEEEQLIMDIILCKVLELEELEIAMASSLKKADVVQPVESAAVAPMDKADSDVDELVEEVLELDDNMGEDNKVGNKLDGSNVNRMLVNSVKATTLKQYSRM